MAEIKVQKDESFESAMKRFKKACIKSGIAQELKKREYYLSPSAKRRRKSEEARKRDARS